VGSLTIFMVEKVYNEQENETSDDEPHDEEGVWHRLWPLPNEVALEPKPEPDQYEEAHKRKESSMTPT